MRYISNTPYLLVYAFYSRFNRLSLEMLLLFLQGVFFLNMNGLQMQWNHAYWQACRQSLQKSTKEAHEHQQEGFPLTLKVY